MSNFQIEIIGLIAAAFTTIAFVPQVIKISKKRTAKGVSITMYVIMFVGICFWFCYGVLIDSISVITANLISGYFAIVYHCFCLDPS